MTKPAKPPDPALDRCGRDADRIRDGRAPADRPDHAAVDGGIPPPREYRCKSCGWNGWLVAHCTYQIRINQQVTTGGAMSVCPHCQQVESTIQRVYQVRMIAPPARGAKP